MEKKAADAAAQAIIDAWVAGDYGRAVGLTHLWQARSGIRVCRGVNPDGTPCGKTLAPQARGEYCHRHRHQDPRQKARVKEARKRKKTRLSSQLPAAGLPKAPGFSQG